jgi:hypothetical protein
MWTPWSKHHFSLIGMEILSLRIFEASEQQQTGYAMNPVRTRYKQLLECC